MGLIASALADGTSIEHGADTEEDDATYLHAAIEALRAKIGVVGASDGSGAVRGVNVYDGDIVFFAIEPANTGEGMELSEPVKNSLNSCIELIKKELSAQ